MNDIDEWIRAADHERHDLRNVEGQSKVVDWNVSDYLGEQNGMFEGRTGNEDQNDD